MRARFSAFDRNLKARVRVSDAKNIQRRVRAKTGAPFVIFLFLFCFVFVHGDLGASFFAVFTPLTLDFELCIGI